MSILPSHNQASASADSPSPTPPLQHQNHGFRRHGRHQHRRPPFPEHPSGSVSTPEDHEGLDSSTKVNEQDGRIPAPALHQGTSSSNGQVSRGASSGRKSQMVSGNHLLNFQYDPINRPHPRPWVPPPRRLPRRKPYNKDLFLQANYKFVMLDSGNNAPESMDPDKMLQWEDIICLKYYTPVQVLCPICLDSPLCPQITPCGHIFCFPCVLQYLMLGEDDQRVEYSKKCPLCFMMVSSKDMFSISIQNVKEYRIGDAIEFWLLTRQKESFALSLKNNERICAVDEIQDSFSKFTFTSDINLSVREAMSDLDSWLARADSGLVDDLEKLPYVCAAIKLLEQRKKYWKERQPSNNHMTCGRSSLAAISEPSNTAKASDACKSASTLSNSGNDQSAACLQNLALDKSTILIDETSGVPESLDCHNEISPSLIEDNHVKLETQDDCWNDGKTNASYNFYQAVDGQNLILHPLSMKCLLHHYGRYDRLPNRISGKILQLESVRQSEEMRKRYRYLSHFSLTATFQFCEIDLTEMLSADALSPFMEEISNREKQRKRLARKEHSEKIKAEASGSHLEPVTNYYQKSHGEAPTTFSLADFEALGSSASASSSPPNIGERQSFSTVARLGFASAHDSPALKMEEAGPLPTSDPSSPSVVMRSSGSGPSFASIASKGKTPEKPEADAVEVAGKTTKKGKKPSRILMSTSGGRRY